MKMLSAWWGAIQDYLFPFLEEALGELSESERSFVAILELLRVEEHVSRGGCGHGRPVSNRRAMARGFVAKAFYNLPTTGALLERLRSDVRLRRLCGFEGAIPSEATFSRAFDEFTANHLPERIHAVLIERTHGVRLVGHISRDSTAIVGREKAVVKPVVERPRRRGRGRPKKGEVVTKEPSRLARQRGQEVEEMIGELAVACDWGTKKNSQGRREIWKGYKLHVDCTEAQVPISFLVTSASVHDSQAAIPLSRLTAERVRHCYELMDAAYDAEEIREDIAARGHVALIDRNRRRGEAVAMDPATQRRFAERTSIERVFARLKDEFGGRTLRVRGPHKAQTHLGFGLLVLTADQLLRLVM